MENLLNMGQSYNQAHNIGQFQGLKLGPSTAFHRPAQADSPRKPANKKAACKAAFCRLENVGADQRE